MRRKQKKEEPVSPFVRTAKADLARIRIAKKLRENQNTTHTDGVLVYQTDIARHEVRSKDWKPQARPANIVPPPYFHIPKEPYTGAELRPFEGRPGAMDFKKYPSKGIG